MRHAEGRAAVRSAGLPTRREAGAAAAWRCRRRGVWRSRSFLASCNRRDIEERVESRPKVDQRSGFARAAPSAPTWRGAPRRVALGTRGAELRQGAHQEAARTISAGFSVYGPMDAPGTWWCSLLYESGSRLTVACAANLPRPCPGVGLAQEATWFVGRAQRTSQRGRPADRRPSTVGGFQRASPRRRSSRHEACGPRRQGG